MKPLLLSLLLSFSFLAQAQNWCPPGAEWAYKTQCPELNGHASLWYEKDTIVGMQPCKKIVGYESYLGSINSYVINIYTFERNDTVFFYDNSSFWPIYFFNASLGDTLLFENQNDPVCDTVLSMLVDSVAIVSVNGENLRYYRAHYIGNNPPNLETFSMQVMEKYGALDNHLLPLIVCDGAADPCYYTLGCYNDSIFNLDSTISCRYFYSKVEDTKLNVEFTLYPNPATNQLNISIEGQAIAKYQILDFTGAMVISNQADNSELSIDVSQLAQGMYLLRVQLSNGQYVVRKFTLKK
jgi:hypothetical protein